MLLLDFCTGEGLLETHVVHEAVLRVLLVPKDGVVSFCWLLRLYFVLHFSSCPFLFRLLLVLELLREEVLLLLLLPLELVDGKDLLLLVFQPVMLVLVLGLADIGLFGLLLRLLFLLLWRRQLHAFLLLVAHLLWVELQGSGSH